MSNIRQWPAPGQFVSLHKAARWLGLTLSVVAVLALIQLAVALATDAGSLLVLAIFSLVLSGSGALYSLLALPGLIAEAEGDVEGEDFDAVTGVHSLAYLEDRLREFEQHARETLRPSIVVYIDLVNLEQVNRDFGYTTGDIVLKTVAQLIVKATRDCDIVGRVVGDEFAVVMPDSTIRDAEKITSIVHRQVEKFHMDLGRRGSIDYLSCKTGTAVFPTDGPNAEAVIAAARADLS